MNKSIALLASFILCWVTTAEAQELSRTEYQTIGFEKVADGFQHPWSLAILDNGSFLITERPGRLNHVSPDGQIQAIPGTPEVSAINQGGLLEVLPHRNFTDNRIVYLTYAKPDPAGSGNTATALARGFLVNDELIAVEDLFVQDRYSSSGRHYGSKLAWLPDGTLLMSIGDRGTDPPRAQDLNDHAGKLLRLTELGQAPADNPFVGQANVKPEIYTYGHRNIQGLIVDSESGEIWATEHGPRGGDELNLITAGGNYGWPVVTLGRDYRTEEQFGTSRRSAPGMINPVTEWTPALAPSGLVSLNTDHFGPWEGNFLAGGLRAEQLRRLVFETGEVVHQEEILRGVLGRIRDARVAPNGDVFVITDAENGALYRIFPAN